MNAIKGRMGAQEHEIMTLPDFIKIFGTNKMGSKACKLIKQEFTDT